jgi:hypothetical protein
MTDYGAPPPPPPEPEPENQGRWLADVIGTVQTPAAALQWFGIVSVVLAALTVTVFLAAPDQVAEVYREQLVEIQKDQAPEDREPLPPARQIARELQIQYVGGGVVSLVCSFLIAYGGICMRQFTGYGWAVGGAVLAAIPCTNSCCCVGTPIGLWALVTLFGSDVRLAFARVGAVGGLGRYEEDMRSRDEDPPSRPIRLE